jgi:hypothetical protein
MRVTLKAVSDELAKRGSTARLTKASGYFFFQGGEADDWLDKTVRVPTVSTFSLPEWMAEFERLQKLNGEIMGGKRGKPAARRKQTRNNG